MIYQTQSFNITIPILGVKEGTIAPSYIQPSDLKPGDHVFIKKPALSEVNVPYLEFGLLFGINQFLHSDIRLRNKNLLKYFSYYDQVKKQHVNLINTRFSELSVNDLHVFPTQNAATSFIAGLYLASQNNKCCRHERAVLRDNNIIYTTKSVDRAQTLMDACIKSNFLYRYVKLRSVYIITVEVLDILYIEGSCAVLKTKGLQLRSKGRLYINRETISQLLNAFNIEPSVKYSFLSIDTISKLMWSITQGQGVQPYHCYNLIRVNNTETHANSYNVTIENSLMFVK